jgi:gliding motility-associated-like protein
MQKITLAILFLFLSISSFSQNWVNSAGGNFNDESYDIEVDATGNIYTTGYTTAASVFGPTISLITNGYSDIYVSKSDPNGNFLWTKVFGGTQADRGYDIAVDAVGDIYVTGYYQGAATFGSTTLTSSGGSQDIFILKLDNTGNVIWVKSDGGSEGDTGYGITFDNLGNIIVTGQFKGNAQIGLNNFNSAIDPNTGLPAYDMFISKYDANGNDLWSIQGIAKYDDRGLALKTDQNNDIYVTGQFSDTLNIAGNQHNNTIYNAGMLLKLDPAGNELWFRRMGAIQTLVYDIEVDNVGDVYITGDFQGQMIIIAPSGNNFLNGNYTYRTFLIKFDTTGEVIWMREDDSGSEVSSKAITLDANQNPYITGTFKCVFDEFADSLGSGFFNSVGYNDIFISKYTKTGQIEWMKQYGGPLDDYCSGIAISQTNNPIIAGSYTEYFSYPVGLSFLPFVSGINKTFPPYIWQTTCNVSPYMYLNAVGAKDIVIAKPVDLSLPHYYYYENTTCYNDKLPCINTLCPDSLVFCGGGQIFDDTHTSGNGFYQENYNAFPTNYQHGPFFDFSWSNGDTTSYTNITSTGYYWVNTQRIDGCSVTNDTVFVTINPIPLMPHLTDDHNFNNQTYPNYQDIILCAPDTAITWFGDLDTTYSFVYTTPSGIFYTDSLPHPIYELGYHTVSITDTNNCSNSTLFKLIYEYATKDTIVPYILQVEDTICLGDDVNYIIADSLTNPTGNLIGYCDTSVYSQSWNINAYSDTCLGGYFYPTTTGWYTITSDFILGYNNLCGLDTTHYTVTDSFYIVVNPKPTATYVLGGDTLLCPGDTINVWTDTIVPGFSWSGPGILIINATGDTIFANQQGTYSYGGVITDSITGCSKSINQSFFVTVKPSPTIISNVPDNIICPGDSILLTCLQPGVAYDWIGPQGNSIGSNQTIWVNVPGFYHCVLTDFDGCVLTSNTIELKEYNTPYILADPGTELCVNGAVQLTAIYSGTPAFFQWLAPISSSNPTVVVNQPGTYIMEVTQCGFTVRDSIVITLASISASITPLTDTIICPGDTAILMANSGMGGYEWNPIQFFGQILQTTDTGDYYVTVTDGSTGCTAVSDTVHIGFHSGGITPNVQNQTICYGDTTSLINLNSGLTTNWYVDSINTTPFLTGDSITLNNLTNDTIIYVENFDSNCTSIRLPVSITISQASFTPTIIGNSSVCPGDSIWLSTTTIPNGTYNWSGPNGFTSNQNPVIILNADSTDSGVYTLSVSDNTCASGDTNITITILPNPLITINAPDTIWKCYSDTISIVASGNYQNILWNTGSSLDSTYAFFTGAYYANIIGINSCSASSDTVYVMNYAIQTPIVSDTTICYGDSVALSSLNDLTLNWYDTTFALITIDSIYQTPALFNSTYYITSYTDSNGCESPSQIISVFVTPANGSPNIFGDTTICEGEGILLTTNLIAGASYQWSNSSGVISNTSSYLNPSVTLNDSGYYYLTVNGVPCINSQASIYITINPTPPPPTILGDTNYCSNDTLLLYTNTTGDTIVWIDSQFNTYYQDSLMLTNLSTLDSGNYYLSIQDSNGCLSLPDTIRITILDAPSIPYIYSNNSYCIGDSINIFTDSILGLSYLWNGPNSFNSIIHENWIFNSGINNSGLYNLTITDSNGCFSTNSVLIQVYEYPSINLGPDTLICIDSLPQFILGVDTIFNTYLWQDGSTNYYYDVLDSGLYYLTVSFGGVCTTTDSIYIQTDSCIIHQSPNVFTPNGDGMNDLFVIENLEYFPNSRLEIFNRWGNLVYSSEDYQNNWDGGNQKTGTYYYIFYPNDPSGKSKIQKGFITLIR